VSATSQHLRSTLLAALAHRPPRAAAAAQNTDCAPAEIARLADQGAFSAEVAEAARTHTTTDWAADVAALTRHLEEVEVGIANGILRSGRSAFELLPLLGGLLWLSPRMLAIVMLFFVLVGWPAKSLRAFFKRDVQALARRHEQLLSASDEAVRFMDLWRTFDRVAAVLAALRTLGHTLASYRVRLAGLSAGLSSFNEVTGALALLLVVWLTQRGALGNVGDGPVLLRFFILLFLAYKPLRDLSDGRLASARGEVALQAISARASSAGALEPTPSSALTPATESAHIHSQASQASQASPAPVRGPELLRLCGVRSAYSTNALTLRIEPGSVTAWMGPTGSGKTSLLRVLLGLERASAGALFYGSEDLAACPPQHRPFAWSPQETPLIWGTLADNILLTPAAPSAAAKAALRAVGAPEYLLAWLARKVGPGGHVLSGGERQWVALARAYASGRPVLLLDEPCSAMDVESEARFHQALPTLKRERTLIYVTHRLKLAQQADAIHRFAAPGELQVADAAML
jgi:ABC-type multidrug transport system fused ATPase/permease subunit